jgi:hypothetical protein
VDPVPDPLLFSLVVPGIEPGPPDLKARTLTTRPHWRSYRFHKTLKKRLTSELNSHTGSYESLLDIKPRSPLKVNRSFGGKCHLHLQDRSELCSMDG